MKTRREFLRTSMIGASAAWTVPFFINNTFAQLDEANKNSVLQHVTGKDAPILVVVQLAGGNDGLNTLVPFADDAYHTARPTIKKNEKQIIKLTDYVGLNSAMPWLGEQYKEGKLGIIQGVGYPNPNRSHFVSTSIWETADLSNKSNTGWLGRFFDNACDGSDPTVGMSFGKTQPESFGASKNSGVCLSSPELYKWMHAGGDNALAEEFFQEMNRPQNENHDDDDVAEGGSIMDSTSKPGVVTGESNLDFLERIALDAQVSSKKILEIAAKYKTKIPYDGTPLARSLNLVARMIAGGLPTRVFYVSHGGFDTHNNQLGAHERLLTQLDSALKSFTQDMKAQGNEQRVMLMTFSEFGRRVAQNASGGTDHGQASCLFTLGGKVKGGLHGKYPSLSELSMGDLKHTTDFRSIYASILTNHLKTNANPILKGDFPLMSFC